MYDVTTLEIMPGAADNWVSVIRNRLAAGDHVRVTFERPSMTPAQMAQEVGVSRATIQRRISTGEIRAERRGNRHRVPLDEVERFRHSYVQELADTLAIDF